MSVTAVPPASAIEPDGSAASWRHASSAVRGHPPAVRASQRRAEVDERARVPRRLGRGAPGAQAAARTGHVPRRRLPDPLAALWRRSSPSSTVCRQPAGRPTDPTQLVRAAPDDRGLGRTWTAADRRGAGVAHPPQHAALPPRTHRRHHGVPASAFRGKPSRSTSHASWRNSRRGGTSRGAHPQRVRWRVGNHVDGPGQRVHGRNTAAAQARRRGVHAKRCVRRRRRPASVVIRRQLVRAGSCSRRDSNPAAGLKARPRCSSAETLVVRERSPSSHVS